ncbi:MAG: aromatic ring-hydroxylating dioxygenase subunit alpha [Brachymonas sp.]|nr:aromatic ring-hydroxylating dioxygenase subunit alpha [Brachymonas sp.]
MTDLSVSRHLADLSLAPLSVESYFSDAVFRQEQQRIFAHAPKYAGHALAVPAVGDYYALPQEGEGRVLMHTPDAAGGSRIELISNVCRHRQAIMLHGRGHQNQPNIICPLHRWTYDTSGNQPTGTLIGAPHFAQDPCLHLNNYPLQAWNGLQFDASKSATGSHDASCTDLKTLLASLPQAKDLDFSGYQFHRAIAHDCAYNWKTFIEVYLEDYHVGPFHPGLGQFVACDDLQWQYGKQWSLQTVGVADKLGKPGSAVYQRWHDAVLSYRNGQPPAHGAIWLTLYPTIMVEWYPHVLTVSTLYPRGPQSTLNLVEFFYPEEICAFEPHFIEAQQAAYMETCEEDDEIALRMDAGRKALHARGDNQSGPYQSPMEDGMQHFHAWYLGAMA